MDGVAFRRRRPDRSTTPTVEKVGGALDSSPHDRCSSLAVGCAFHGDSRDLVTQGTVSGPSPCCCVMPSWCTRACDSVRPRRPTSRPPGRSHRRRLETTVRGLAVPPDVLVDATGSDHPRRAGLAIHLGAVLEPRPRRHRPLTGEGAWPADRRGATSHVRIGDDVVASWVRTRPGTRPVVVHPWRVGLDDAGSGPAAHPASTHSRAAQTRTQPARRSRAVAAHASRTVSPERAVDSVHAMCFAAESAHLAATTSP